MSHFAKVVDGEVVEVIVAEQDFIDSLPDKDFWIQTSYNTRHGVHLSPETGEPDGGVALRANFAGVGYSYDEEHDVFIPPQPEWPSWVLNTEIWDWVAPVECPVTFNENGDPDSYQWDEDTLQWEKEL